MKILQLIFLRVLSSIMHLTIPFSISFYSIFLVLLLGILVPLGAAIPSIQSLFQEVEQNARSDGNQVIEYKVRHSGKKRILSPLVISLSLLMTVCGVCIYYLLPLGFISNNMTVCRRILHLFLLLLLSQLDCVLRVYDHSHRIDNRTGLTHLTPSSSTHSSLPEGIGMLFPNWCKTLFLPYHSQSSSSDPEDAVVTCVWLYGDSFSRHDRNLPSKHADH